MATRHRGARRFVAIAAGLAVVAGSVAVSASLAQIAFGDGTYRVPQDIRPGTYRTRGGDGCYWARLKNFSGQLDAIKANSFADGPAVVTILRADRGFETQRCGNWTRNLARITSSKTRFGEGTFIVGTDIKPGTYRSSKGKNCYWARLRSFTGELDAIIANHLGGRAIVTIERSDRGFHSQRCGTWTRA